MTNEDREKTLRDACAKAIALGWRIAPDITVDQSAKRCCPQGALLAGETALLYDARRSIYLALDVGGAWFAGFARGFDGDDVGTSLPEAFALGQKFRAEFVKEPS